MDQAGGTWSVTRLLEWFCFSHISVQSHVWNITLSRLKIWHWIFFLLVVKADLLSVTHLDLELKL